MVFACLGECKMLLGLAGMPADIGLRLAALVHESSAQSANASRAAAQLGVQRPAWRGVESS